MWEKYEGISRSCFVFFGGVCVGWWGGVVSLLCPTYVSSSWGKESICPKKKCVCFTCMLSIETSRASAVCGDCVKNGRLRLQ